MTTFAAHEETDRRLAELDGLTRDAWEQYQAELRLLDSKAYAITEPAAWDALQLTLAEVQLERTKLLAPEAH